MSIFDYKNPYYKMSVNILSNNLGNCIVVNGKYMFNCGCSAQKIRTNIFMPDIKACFISNPNKEHTRSISYVLKFTNVFMTQDVLAKLNLDLDKNHNIYLLPKNEHNYINIDKGTAYYFYLDHNVGKVGYIVYDDQLKLIIIHITDTASILETIRIPTGLYDYNLYLIYEANYTKEKAVDKLIEDNKNFLTKYIENNCDKVSRTELHIIRAGKQSDTNYINRTSEEECYERKIYPK